MKNFALLCTLLSIIFLSCKDNNDGQPSASDAQKQIISDLSYNIYFMTYGHLSDATSKLHDDVVSFVAGPSQSGLDACRADWKKAREYWENSEAWLFGPVATESIDPRIDTWPVDFIRLDSVLNSGNAFTEPYINNLEESLKGFHPIEYLLFGRNGHKSYTEFTQAQKDYLLALSTNLKTLTAELNKSWSESGGNYLGEINNAGTSTIYPTKLSAYEEIVNAMIGICDEVANGKMGEVLTNLDSMGEESPFAKNSIVDFTNNIKGVQNVYLAVFAGKDTKGMEDFVRTYNLSLDSRIKQKMDAAISALGQVTLPFGEAIFTQPIQVQNAIEAINALKDELETGLLPLVRQRVK